MNAATSHGHLLALVRHRGVSVTDLAGTELRHVDLPLRVDAAPGPVLGPVLDAASALLSGGGPAEQLVGVAFGVPAAVDPVTAHFLPTSGGWPPDAVVRAVGGRWDVPLVVENDARAAAVGECDADGEILVVVDRVRDRVRAAVEERAWPLVEASALGQRSTARGLARLVVRRVFAPAAVDAVVAAGDSGQELSAGGARVAPDGNRCERRAR